MWGEKKKKMKEEEGQQRETLEDLTPKSRWIVFVPFGARL
jgi:hypothetical protein